MDSSSPCSTLQLPIELAEPILVHTILLHTTPVVQGATKPIHAPLNTLSRTLIPDVTRAALTQLWWYSLDDVTPTDIPWLLPMLVDLDTRGTRSRPLAYSVQGLCAAARHGDMDTLDAWYHAGLLSDRKASKLYLVRHAAADSGNPAVLMSVLEWWLKRKLPWGDRAAVEADLVLAMDTGVLEWWKAQGLIAWPPAEALARASGEGRVDLLEWWMLHYAQHVREIPAGVLEAAVVPGNVHVLRWWVARFPIGGGGAGAAPDAQNGVAKMLGNVVELASRYGCVRVLDWWLEQLPMLARHQVKWSPGALDRAAENGNIDVLDWWFSHSTTSHSGIRLKTKYKWALDWACAAGRLDVLEWFVDHQQHPNRPRDCILELRSANTCPLFCFPGAHARSISIECLDWRIKHGITTRFSAKGMAMLSHEGRRDVLDWISREKVEFAYDVHAVDRASFSGHVDVLDWWLTMSGKEFNYLSLSVLDTPHLPVLQWWADHAAAGEPDLDLSDCLCLSSHVDNKDILTWALQHSNVPGTLIDHCVELCVSKSDFAMLEYCLQTYPGYSWSALVEFGLKTAMYHGQFGMLAFITNHAILTPDELDDIVNRSCQSELTRLAQIGCLAFLDWIRRHRQQQQQQPPKDQASPFFVAQKDLDAARERGDLGFRRWVKSRQVEIREHAFVDIEAEFGQAVADDEFENGFALDLDELPSVNDDDDGGGDDLGVLVEDDLDGSDQGGSGGGDTDGGEHDDATSSGE